MQFYFSKPATNILLFINDEIGGTSKCLDYLCNSFMKNSSQCCRYDRYIPFVDCFILTENIEQETQKCKYLNCRRGKDQLFSVFHYNVFEKFHVSFVVKAQKLFSSSFFSKITILLSRNLSPSHFDKWTSKIQVTILFESHLAADSVVTQSLANKSNKRIAFLFYFIQAFNRDVVWGKCCFSSCCIAAIQTKLCYLSAK